MFKNYFKTAWRNLTKHRVYASINICGLAIGLAVCMLIIVYVEHESSYDSFHKNADRIYWIQNKMKMGNDSIFLPKMSFATAPLTKQADASVESYMRLMYDYRKPVVQSIQSPSLKFVDENFVFADRNFFSFFSFNLISGNAQQVLNNPFTVVISKNAAKKFFGNDNPVGKILRYNNALNFTITGVADNAPSNSSISYDFIASISSIQSINEYKDVLESQTVQGGAFTTYFLLKNSADASNLEKTLFQLNHATDKQSSESYIATRLTDTHLHANYSDSSNTKYLSVFPFVAALILLLALTNYISLATARSSTRAKEIGVRKAMGATKQSIASQFFIESAIYTALSFIIAYILCSLFQPVFFSFLQIHIDNSFLYNTNLLLSFASLFVITVILASSYPSFLLSAFKPVQVLYGKLSRQPGGGLSLRKFITVFQFSISVVLIICGIVINKQIHFILNANTGVNKDNIVMIPFAPSIGKYYPAFRHETALLAGVQRTTTAHYPMYKGYDEFFTKAYNTSTDVSLPVLTADENFIPMLGLQWKIPPADTAYIQKNRVIINEAAITKLNLGRVPVNKQIHLGNQDYEIAGILKDFNYETLQNKINALCLFIAPDTASNWGMEGGCLFAKLQPNANAHQVIQQMKATYEKYDKEKPFEYSFMDDAFNDLYRAEERLSKIFTVFISLTILIACLGLFGLAAFIAVQRTKEIGIRKVLGASVIHVVLLLSKDFIKLVAVAILIAAPVAWWLMNKWLQNFAYRTALSWWIFIVTGLFVTFLALATVGYQSIKAAIANPVKSLRTE